MQESELISNLELIIERGLPFACWSLPESDEWECIGQKNNFKHYLDSTFSDGFAVAPFELKGKIRSIFPDFRFSSTEDLNFDIKTLEKNEELVISPPYEISYEDYTSNCETLIEEIKSTSIEKVVLSRVSKKVIKEKLSTVFNKMRKAYPKAMVFLYRLDSCLWVGASPEIFVLADSNQFSTMALAGSKRANSSTDWTDKEKEEQGYVEFYIEEVLKNEGIKYHKTGPMTVNAGPVAHIQSIYEGRLNENEILPLLRKLHPTPAVCGIPAVKAKSIILEKEKHDRLDYTGFIGPVKNGNVKLYVNLRSGALIDQNLYLFLGGGITKDSIADKEWKETELKAETLLSIL